MIFRMIRCYFIKDKVYLIKYRRCCLYLIKYRCCVFFGCSVKKITEVATTSGRCHGTDETPLEVTTAITSPIMEYHRLENEMSRNALFVCRNFNGPQFAVDAGSTGPTHTKNSVLVVCQQSGVKLTRRPTKTSVARTQIDAFIPNP